MEMDAQKILSTLTHRFPFLLVDRVLELVPSERIRALKNVSINEPFFPGHFPERPIMPGVLILEAMAQACAILAAESLSVKLGKDAIFLFAGADDVRFKRPVLPGDQLILEGQMGRVKGGIGKFQARALVGEQLACEAELICALRRMGESD